MDTRMTKAIKATVVRPSPIHGRGLFALRDFAKGEVVEEVTATIVWGEPRSRFAVQWRKQWYNLTNKSKYLNHSWEPNCVLDLSKAVVKAIRPIHKGEELTIRYATPF